MNSKSDHCHPPRAKPEVSQTAVQCPRMAPKCCGLLHAKNAAMKCNLVGSLIPIHIKIFVQLLIWLYRESLTLPDSSAASTLSHRGSFATPASTSSWAPPSPARGGPLVLGGVAALAVVAVLAVADVDVEDASGDLAGERGHHHEALVCPVPVSIAVAIAAEAKRICRKLPAPRRRAHLLLQLRLGRLHLVHRWGLRAVGQQVRERAPPRALVLPADLRESPRVLLREHLAELGGVAVVTLRNVLRPRLRSQRSPRPVLAQQRLEAAVHLDGPRPNTRPGRLPAGSAGGARRS